MDSSLDIEEKAADWLAKKDGGNWSERDEEALAAWLSSATAHWAAYIRLRAGWQEAGRLQAMGAGLKSGPPPREERRFVPFFGAEKAIPGGARTRERRSGRWARWAAAAVFVVGIPVAVQYGLLSQTRYSTPVGGLSTLPLPDGSQVTLNTASEIRLAVSNTERSVELRRGEAFFNVEKDPARPFVVRAGHKRITVLGTQFSVRRDQDQLRVVVTEGTVRLDNTVLSAGAVARDGGLGLKLEKRSAPELDAMLSWRSGFIVFQDIELSAAVAEFNRYLTRQLVISDPSIASIRVGGMFRVANVEAFLRILQADFPVAVERRGDRIELKSP